MTTLQRHKIKNSKQIWPEIELRGLVPRSYIYVSGRAIPTIGLPILLQENRWTDRGNIEIAHKYMNVKSRTERPRSFFSGKT
jgi:hypothetical protein